ncbi:2815_t:CDS:2, partial [Scutellospora calospora]
SEADNNKNFLSDLINNFEYVPENDIKDVESMGLASESLMSDGIETGNIDNNLDVDVEIIQQSQSNQNRSDNVRQQSNEDNQYVKYQRKYITNSKK